MAKSARSRTVKVNNRALKAKVFGPVEDARTARLSAKLLELAAQPKPQRDAKMEEDAGEGVDEAKGESEAVKTQDTMDLDTGASATTDKKRIEKRRVKKRSSILFPNRYANKKKTKK